MGSMGSASNMGSMGGSSAGPPSGSTKYEGFGSEDIKKMGYGNSSTGFGQTTAYDPYTTKASEAVKPKEKKKKKVVVESSSDSDDGDSDSDDAWDDSDEEEKKKKAKKEKKKADKKPVGLKAAPTATRQIEG